MRRATLCHDGRMPQDQVPGDQVHGPDAGPGWRAGAVAARLGVAASTLRSWNQRYGLGPSGHHPGRHRRYTAADIARLERMRALVTTGIPPAEAARWAHRDLPDPSPDPDPVPRPVPPAAVTSLLVATQRLEAAAMSTALRRHLDERGVIDTWEQVCRPVLGEINRVHREQGGCIDAEHLLSWSISAALHQVVETSRVPGSRTAVLACVTGERHTLALEALRAALAERGTPAHMLGADTPDAALVPALIRLRPDVLVLWAQSTSTARPSRLRVLRAAEYRPGLVVAAGPGWDTERLLPGVLAVDSLGAAVHLIQDAAVAA